MGWNRTAPLPGVELPECEHPKSLVMARRVDDIMFVPGRGPNSADIMFITPSVNEDEVLEESTSFYGNTIKQRPFFMKGPAAEIFKEVIMAHNIDPEKCYFTAACKWLLPKANRNKPKKTQLNYGREFLLKEIERVKPQIIVCMGKSVFDMLYPLKFKMQDIQGGWFWSEELRTRLFVMPEMYKPVVSPDFVEKFHIDIRDLKRMYDKVNGVELEQVPLNYRTIKNAQELRDLVLLWKIERRKLFSVDCEWKGIQHLDGRLRSLQLCWAPGEGAYIRFMDDEGNYVFDVDYKESGRIMAEVLDLPDVKYLGHHYAADAPWMNHVLGLEVYGKCLLDTEFAQQVADEHEDLALERLAMKYTDLGRYDIQLEIWKKRHNSKKCKKHGVPVDEAGYAFIPDNILIPYAIKDVDTVMRAYPFIREDLEYQKVWDYYQTITNPFVTDVFTSFVMLGLPVETKLMESLRKVYSYVKDRMEESLRKDVELEAWEIAFKAFIEFPKYDFDTRMEAYNSFREQWDQGDFETATEIFKGYFGASGYPDKAPLLEHLEVAADFNIRSQPQMRRWLFDVKKYIPIKSTNNKNADLPSISWEKVRGFPEDVQRKYNPSTDKQSIEMLSDQHNDKILDKLLELNAVGNLVKAFLKPAELDEDGNLVRENGLAFWVASDNRIHGQYSCTETGRPRAWKPNVLNWPKYVNKQIVGAIQRVVEEDSKNGVLPEFLEEYVGMDPKKFPSIRSCISVKEVEPLEGSAGWCFVESDLDTAEIVGAAYIAGDFQMIAAAIDPDPAFGIARFGEGDAAKEYPIRLKYADGCGIDLVKQNPNLLGKYAKPHGWMELSNNSKEAWAKIDKLCEAAPDQYALSYDGYVELIPIGDDQWVRDDSGKLKHPRHDLHWEIAESVMRDCREVLNKDKHRDGIGKPANFSIAYGATESSLERAVRAATKETPPEGTGHGMLSAYAERYPVANAFFEGQEYLPETEGKYVAVSGRVRHFKAHRSGAYGLSDRQRGGYLSSEQRQARNFPLQNNVADTMCLAAVGLLYDCIRLGLKARPLALLYDSLVTFCPIEERAQVVELHNKWMHEKVYWKTPGGILRYTIDTDYCMRWSTTRATADSDLLGKPPPSKNIRMQDPMPRERIDQLIKIGLLEAA